MSQLQARLLALTPRRVVEILSRVKASSRRMRAARRYKSLVEEIFPAAKGHRLLAATDDAAVLRVDTDAELSTILKVASTSISSEQLEVESSALDELRALSELGDWRSHVAVVHDRGTHDAGAWFTQSVVPGVAGSTIDIDSGQLTSAAIAALGPVHDATATALTADKDVLDRIVTNPLATIAHWRPTLAESLAGIGDELRRQISGKQLTLSRLHGDFAPTNVLWDTETETISGIVDWKFSEQRLPPEIDGVHFALSLIAKRRRAEYGDTVTWLLGEGATSVEAAAVRAATEAGPNDFDVNLGVTMAWLQHVSFGLHKAHDLRTNPIWLVNNIDRVVNSLHSGPWGNK